LDEKKTFKSSIEKPVGKTPGTLSFNNKTVVHIRHNDKDKDYL